MTPAQIFDSLTYQEKIRIIEENVNIPSGAVTRDFVALSLIGVEPRFRDLQYDIQEAVLPALRKKGVV